MSPLAALTRAYERLSNASPYGFSSQKISFCVMLNPDGSVADVRDLRDSDRKHSARMMFVPQAVRRTKDFSPNFLWDKTAYVLGVTASEDKRAADALAAFRARHLQWLAGTADEGLQAMTHFLQRWTPEAFVAPMWPEHMRDQNLVFALSNAGHECYLHDRPAARAAWQQIGAAGGSDPKICLVSGTSGPVVRIHPSIKGVWGAQPTGASLISFNLDASTSYGHVQGENAPVSEAATFAYAISLNRFLEKGSHHRIQIGDASTVFWADCSDARGAEESERLFAAFFEPAATDAISIGARLEALSNGKNLKEIAPELNESVRFHVLGLAPNAARLAVRFYWESDFGQVIANCQRYLADTAIDPPPHEVRPPLWLYLRELAVLGKSENIPPSLAGEWMRAILTGGPYPMTLLSTALMRIRSDRNISALRVAIVKSVLIRNLNMEIPVGLDQTNTNKGYILGRLFAVYEEVQRVALGGNVKSTIKDKFYGLASATPQKVFSMLSFGCQNHFARMKLQNPGRAVNLEKLLMTIMDLMEPGAEPIPIALASNEQALFSIGYYHQRSYFFRTQGDNRQSFMDSTQ